MSDILCDPNGDRVPDDGGVEVGVGVQSKVGAREEEDRGQDGHQVGQPDGRLEHLENGVPVGEAVGAGNMAMYYDGGAGGVTYLGTAYAMDIMMVGSVGCPRARRDST